MRRKEKEITDLRDIETVIRNAQVCRLGFSDNGIPYVVPVSFGYEPGVIWIHSAQEGKKIDILKTNPQVCFEFDEINGIVKADDPCKSGIRYQSVIGSGKAEFVEDIAGKMQGLNRIMNQYSGLGEFTFPLPMLEKVCLIRIRIDKMTGKRSG